ncbi:hypothetical protein WMO41_07855 [Ventrimonas sp. CLA-AP-H27]|uniref:Type II secretion system protein n=1 Tax=Ventrimonas faecis TaxID=3133170 RepID=A0ABV1HM82_9FIRM
MNKRSGSGSGIFLMEMMVVVFFFMLCASTCILAFAKSDRMSRLAWERDHAVSAAQSVAEVWKLSEEQQEGEQSLYWNADWEETENQSEAVYTGSLTETSKEDGIQNLQIVIREAGEDGEELFALDAAKYVRP